MRRWTAGCLWVVLAVILAASSTPADPIVGSTTWVATETTVEANATTQIYFWSFVGPTDFTVTESFAFSSPSFGGFNFFPTDHSISGISNEDFVGSGFVNDLIIVDAIFILTGAESPRSGCSVSDFPPCELGVVNVFSVTMGWAVIPEGPGGELETTLGKFSFPTLLESVPVSSTPEPSTLLLLGAGLIGLSRLRKWNQSRTRAASRRKI